MASLSTNIRTYAPIGLRHVGERILAILVALAEFSPQYRAVMYYNALSDEELAELGMTRADVVERVFGARRYL